MVMPISNDEFNQGERAPVERKGSLKTSPSAQTVKKVVQHKGRIKGYGQYNQKKFFVKFAEGPDDKAMFHEEHWKKFKSGDKIEFESKYNPESEWHGIHKRHYVGVIEKDEYDTLEIELEVELGYITKWKGEEDGELTCKAYLKEEVDDIGTIHFSEDTAFTDYDFEYSQCKIFGKKDGTVLYAQTVEILSKSKVRYDIEIPLNELYYHEGSVSFKHGGAKGSLIASWSSTVLNRDKDSYIGSLHIDDNFRIHGRWYKEVGDWKEKMQYILHGANYDIKDEYIAMFEEYTTSNRMKGFIKGVYKNLDRGSYYTFTEIIDMATESGVQLEREYVRELFWKANYRREYWDFLIEIAGEPLICNGFFIFREEALQIFEVPSADKCTHIFKELSDMNLAMKIKEFLEGKVEDRMGLFSSIPHDYLGLWKAKIERVI